MLSSRTRRLAASSCLGVLVWVHLSTRALAEENEIRISGSAAAIENVFRRIKAPFEKATQIKLVLNTVSPIQALQDLDEEKIEAASEALEIMAWLDLMRKENSAIVNPGAYKHRVVGRDRIQVVCNRSVSPVAKLSAEQLTGIFTGKIHNWKEVGGPEQPIRVVYNGQEPGMHRLWQQRVMEGADWSSSRKDLAPGEDVRKVVAATAGAVAIVPLGLREPYLHVPETPDVGRPITVVTKGIPSDAMLKLYEFLAGEGQKLVLK
ncbi:MAG: substrate-binding domain-containing protein [Oligoflexia bacterium]|nr:substrate-binding domain-containing protein [Oligoflexia bacterium]